MFASIIARFFTTFIHWLTGSRARWDAPPVAGARVYYGNHSSHGDFVLIWSALPAALRRQTRPVAAADYWCRGGLREYLIRRVFNAVLINRDRSQRQQDPVVQMAAAIQTGTALILFPEGTRTPGRAVQPFKTGLFHLASHCPELQMVPVWLDNLNRVMPKGRVLPLPLLCTVHFGTPLTLQANEGKEDFLARARLALLDLAPREAT